MTAHHHPHHHDHEHAGLGDLADAEQFWERHYGRSEQVWSGNANPLLVEVVGPLQPGTVLDLGCGEGGDAVWLAQQGWRVTAVDISPTALTRAAARVSAAGMSDRVELQQHDLPDSFPGGSFDLVSAMYLQSPVEFPRTRVLQAAARAVAPGGLLLVVEHGSVPSWSWAAPQIRFPAPEEVLATLDLPLGQWRSERVDAPSRQSVGPGGETGTVTDNVIAVRRLPS